MKPKLNKKYLITTDSWFIAPDGNKYKAVFGTVTMVRAAAKQSSDWYIRVGKMTIAGCRVRCCIECNTVSTRLPKRDIVHNGLIKTGYDHTSRIFITE